QCTDGRPAAQGRQWGRAPEARLYRARSSLPNLGPPVAGRPADFLARLEVDQSGGILLRQGGGPVLEPGLGQVGGFGVWAAEGALKQGTPTPLELAPSSLLEELAPVLLESVDLPDQVSGQGHGHALTGRHSPPQYDHALNRPRRPGHRHPDGGAHPRVPHHQARGARVLPNSPRGVAVPPLPRVRTSPAALAGR